MELNACKKILRGILKIFWWSFFLFLWLVGNFGIVQVEDEKCQDVKPSSTEMCRPEKPPGVVRSKKCTLGLPEKYMESVWNQLDRD